MNWFLTADWHLTDDPNDSYRWGFFPWLREKIRSVTYDPADGQYAGGGTLFVLGDLTQNKDRHSSKLVNRLSDEIAATFKQTGLNRIVILKANHDGLDRPYFEFLRHLPYVQYITEPQVIELDGKRIALLPHTKDPEHDWKGIDFSIGNLQYVMAHATVTGAQAESGFVLSGTKGFGVLTRTSLSLLAGESRIFSGDVHVPQRIGTLEYVGAPYPIRFGDNFRGRVICLYPGRDRQEWHYPTIRKRKITADSVERLALLAIGLRPEDQLKVELALPKSERHGWHQLREEVQKWADKRGVLLKGVELAAAPTLRIGDSSKQLSSFSRTVAQSPSEALDKYLKKNKSDDETAKTGRIILRKAEK